MKPVWKLFIVGLILLGLGACTNQDATPVSPTSSPTLISSVLTSPLAPTALSSPLDVPSATVTLLPLTPKAGFGAAQGVIITYPSDWASGEFYVYFAPVSLDEQSGGGFYVLEPSIHPRAKVNPSNVFQQDSIPPGEYVVVVGPTPEEAIVIRDGDRPHIFEFLEGQVLDMGEVDLKY